MRSRALLEPLRAAALSRLAAVHVSCEGAIVDDVRMSVGARFEHLLRP